MRYSKKFREKMIEKMTGPGARSTMALSQDAGVSQTTLWRWRQEAKMVPMNQPVRSRRNPADMMRILKEAVSLDDAALGAFLRREGLHASDLSRFREEVFEAASAGFEARRKKRGLSTEQKELRALKKELVRKDKALAEAAALLVLRGKWQAFLAECEEGAADEESEK